MNSLIINLGLFKAGWLAAVLTAASSMPIAGTAVIAVAVLVHLLRADNRQGELQLLILAAVLGVVWESTLVSLGLVEYRAAAVIPGMAPYWIVAMWVLFATTLNIGMRWMQKSVLIAAIAGAVGGPMSFLAGQKAGAVAFPDPLVSLAVISVGWAIFLPLLVRFAGRSDAPATVPA